MKKAEIVLGGTYSAKVSGKLTVVRVDAIRDRPGVLVYRDYGGVGRRAIRSETSYDVTNLSTGRKIVFRSAAKFRSAVNPDYFACAGGCGKHMTANKPWRCLDCCKALRDLSSPTVVETPATVARGVQADNCWID